MVELLQPHHDDEPGYNGANDEDHLGEDTHRARCSKRLPPKPQKPPRPPFKPSGIVRPAPREDRRPKAALDRNSLRVGHHGFDQVDNILSPLSKQCLETGYNPRRSTKRRSVRDTLKTPSLGTHDQANQS